MDKTKPQNQKTDAHEPDIFVACVAPPDLSPLKGMLGGLAYDMLMHGVENPDLVQLIHDGSIWYGLIAWNIADAPSPDRDHYIGWHMAQRAERIKLIAKVQQFIHRPVFSGSPDFGRLAVRYALKSLPENWERFIGYKPLMAEARLPVRSHYSNCLKGNGWKKLSYRAPDHHVTHWIQELTLDARTILRRKKLKPTEDGYEVSNFNLLPLPDKLLPSLKETLDTIKDPRAENSQYPLGSILALMFMATICGCGNFKQLTEFGRRLSHQQTVLLSLPFRKKNGMRMEPGYYIYYNLLKRLNMSNVTAVLLTWLYEHEEELPKVLSPKDPLVIETMQAMVLGYGPSLRLKEQDQLDWNRLKGAPSAPLPNIR